MTINVPTYLDQKSSKILLNIIQIDRRIINNLTLTFGKQFFAHSLIIDYRRMMVELLPTILYI